MNITKEYLIGRIEEVKGTKSIPDAFSTLQTAFQNERLFQKMCNREHIRANELSQDMFIFRYLVEGENENNRFYGAEMFQSVEDENGRVTEYAYGEKPFQFATEALSFAKESYQTLRQDKQNVSITIEEKEDGLLLLHFLTYQTRIRYGCRIRTYGKQYRFDTSVKVACKELSLV